MSKPVLHDIDEFREVLKNYRVSDHGKAVLAKSNLLVFNGPAAGGRNTIINFLAETAKYSHIVSDTTRPQRINDGVKEVDGLQYWFRDEEEVLKDLHAGEFVEAAIIHNQQVSGTPIRELEAALKRDEVSILEIQYEGVSNVILEKPDANVIWLTPPSFDEWLNRLRKRGNITPEEFHNRFLSAEAEYEHALTNSYYNYVMNDDYKLAAGRVRQIVETHNYPDEENERAREASVEIYQRIRQELGRD